MKKILFTIWIIWMILLVGVILFASGPIDLNITNTTATNTCLFYGLTFGLPLVCLGLDSLIIEDNR